jgi:hypothetical protein
MKDGHMSTKIKKQSTAFSVEERQRIRAMLARLERAGGAAPANDESIYTRRGAI